MEESGFRRIQVLRLALLDDAPTESDHPATHVADREHDAVAEAVVIMLSLADLPPLALDDQTQLRQCFALRLGAAEALQHLVPGIRCITDAKVLDSGSLEPAALQVLPGARIAGE